VLEYKIGKKDFSFRWTNCVKGFNMPLKVKFGSEMWIEPTEEWKTIQSKDEDKGESLKVDRNFYVKVKKLE
jgi:hypothetical protein